MARERPLWMENPIPGVTVYPARLDRQFIDAVMRRQQRVFRGLVVSQMAVPGFGVQITSGDLVVACTTLADGGMWYARSTATETVSGGAFPATPGAPRTDLIVATIRDPNAGGLAGYDWILAAQAGTVVPANSVAIASIARIPGESNIANAAITDIAPRGEWAWTVSSVPPVGRGVPGDLWVVAS